MQAKTCEAPSMKSRGVGEGRRNGPMEAADPQLPIERATNMQKRRQMGMILLNIPMYTFLGEIISLQSKDRKALQSRQTCKTSYTHFVHLATELEN